MKYKKLHRLLGRAYLLLIYSAIIFSAITVEANCIDGIVSYWTMNEMTQGIYADDIGSNQASCSSGCPTPTPVGRILYAQVFNGTSTGLNASGTDFNWGQNNSFSIEYWLKKDSGTLVDDEVIVGRFDTTNNLEWSSGIWSTGEASFVLIAKNGDGNNTQDLLQGTTNLADGNWHHIAVIRDSNSQKNILYVDGIIEDERTVTYTEGFDSLSADLNIGWLDIDTGYHFNGAIDELAIYNTALSDTEVIQHFNDGHIGLRLGYCGSGNPIKIMPLGDSITKGFNNSITNNNFQVGYRQDLNLDLINGGYDVDFVGGLQSGQLATPIFDFDHEGNGGWTADQVAAEIFNWLVATPADVVLLHIGTNDLTAGDTSPSDV